MDWLSVLLLVVIAVAFVLALRSMRKHGSACGGCCKDCPGRAECEAKKRQAGDQQ